MYRPKLLAQKLSKYEKGFLLFIIEKDLSRIMHDVVDLDRYIKAQYNFYLYLKTFKKWVVETNKLSRLSLRENPSAFIKQNDLCDKLDRKAEKYRQKYEKLSGEN